MTPEQAVVERVLSIGAVTALIGTRGHLLKLPQGSPFPAVRVQLVDENGSAHLRGGAGHHRSRVQVDAYAAEGSGVDAYTEAEALADAIHGDGGGSGLDGWAGTVGGSPTIEITGALRVDRAVSYEAAEQRLVRVRQDYMVGWKRA